MNLRSWTFLACIFGPRFGFALVVSYYLGGVTVVGAAVLGGILYLCR